MVATGIVRRIDDLGRIVIPREIRKSMKIQAGDSLEIYVNPKTNSITLTPFEYNPKANLQEVAEYLTNTEKYSEIANEVQKIIKKIEKIEKNS